MKNCEFTIDGQILTIKVDLSKNHGRSKSGKSIVIGTTSGNVPVDPADHPGVAAGVNVYKIA